MSKITIRNIIIASILMLTASSVLGLMVYQVLKQGDHLVLQVKTLEKERAQEDSYIYLQRLEERTTDDRSDLKRHFLPSESKSIDFLNNVDSLAEIADIVLETSDIKSIQDEDNSKWIQATFEFAGSKKQIISFIKILETLPYVSQLMGVSIKALSDDDWIASVTMQVRILNYGE